LTGKPKVAHVLIPYLPPTETFIYDRLTNHSRYSPFIITDEPVINLDTFPFVGDIFSLANLPPIVRRFNTLLKKSAGISLYYRTILAREKPDVVHAHFGPVGVSVALAAAALRIPLVVSFYGIDASALLSDPRYKHAYKRLFRIAAIISALSDDMAGRLSDAGCPEEKIRVHHLAVDTAALTPAPDKKTGGSLEIVTAGRFVPKKGHLLLAIAFALLIDSGVDARLSFYGDGQLLENVKTIVAEKGLTDRIRFFGHRSRAETLEAIRNAHIFALFSVTAPDGDMEGTPTVLIEAGALGIPAVSTRHAGIPEIIDDRHTGLLASERHVEGFALALGRLAADPELRASMGHAARERIVSAFDIRKVMETIESDYDSLY
jgi:colanic acid/amylovoran biosynthesis glycosyltransferase